MKQDLRFETKKTPVIPAILIAISAFIGVFFTYGLVIDSLESASRIEDAKIKQAEVGKMLDTLSAFKEMSKKEESSGQKYIGQFREDLILEDIFKLIGEKAKIGAISLSPGEKLSSGLTLSNITVSIETQTLEDFLVILDTATGKGANQKYIIRSLSIPYESGQDTSVSTTLQLGMYTIQ